MTTHTIKIFRNLQSGDLMWVNMRKLTLYRILGNLQTGFNQGRMIRIYG